jgi:phosphohistidine phosphatase SixA
MKFIKYLLVIFISINTSIKADSKEILINKLDQGGKLIFIRHAYAPGNGDPSNFDINDCSSQRNLNSVGKAQSVKIGSFFNENSIKFEKVYTSQWCRCKDTALIAFNSFKQKSFLNSFYSSKFAQNKNYQIDELKKFIENWDGKQNLIFVTHYVVIFEILNYAPSSGEIVVTDKNFKVIDTISIPY